MTTRFMDRLAGLPGLDRLVRLADDRRGDGSIFDACRAVAGIRIEIDEDDLARIPASGPILVAANHPTGFAEGLALPGLIDAVRDDLRVVAHAFFLRWPALAGRMILVDPRANGDGRRVNRAGFLDAVRTLRAGGAVLVFPAGEVAAPDERPWNSGFVRMARLSGATVVPVHVSGRTGWVHGLLSRIHPRLGVLALARELGRWRGRTLKVRVGDPVPAAALGDDFDDDAVAADVRGRIAALGVTRQVPTNRPALAPRDRSIRAASA